MQLHERIRLARVRAGLTQKQVADHFRISRPTVTQWESGDYRPDQDKLPELAALLNVTLKWLMNEDGDGPAVNGKINQSQSPPQAKFLRSSKHKFYIREWREFMGSAIDAGARVAGLSTDEYQAFETHPINFTLAQIVALADEFGIRGDQFWWEPPKNRPSAIVNLKKDKRARR